MKKIIYTGLMSLSIITMTISCKKSNEVIINNPGNNGRGNVSWTFDGVSSSCDSSFVSLRNNTIMAYKDLSTVPSKTINIRLANLSVGSYMLSATVPNVLTYIISTTLDHTSQTGTVNITANTGTALSGNFSAAMENGLTLSGTFSEVPIRQ